MRTVLCFGDSNTHGTMALTGPGHMARLPKGQRWPDILGQRLGAEWDVIAEGHPARTTVLDDPIDGPHKSGLRILPALLESHRPLDVVVVMLGTNDLKQRFGLPVSDIAFGVERLVRLIRSSDSGPNGNAPAVVIASPVPIDEIGFLGEMFAGGAEKSRALATSLAGVAQRQAVGFVDLAAAGPVDPVDGIHLPPATHVGIADLIAPQVRAIVTDED